MVDQSSKVLHVSLWITQALLAALFLMVGITKTVQPIEALAPSMHWVTQVPVAFVRFIGVSEIAGAIGLILPSALRIMPRLTVLAAVGLALIMLPAIAVHAAAGEYIGIGGNVLIAGLALFIIYGRSKKVVILPR